MKIEKWKDSGDDPESRRESSTISDFPITYDELEEAWRANYNPANKRVNKGHKKLAKSVEEAELQRLGQSNKLRPLFMWSALAITGLLVASSCFVAIWLTIFERMSNAIGVGFIVSLGVETIGIIAIIAHYLFSTPESRFLWDHQEDEN